MDAFKFFFLQKFVITSTVSIKSIDSYDIKVSNRELECAPKLNHP